MDESWKFSCQPKGWSTNFHELEWFHHCFEPATCELSDDACKLRVLIFDGHESHLSSQFLAHALDNNIHLLMLPPHTSHLLQPLDVGVFGPLKSAMSKCLDKLIRTGISRLEKVEWVEKYIEARPYAFTKSNIDGAWRGAGLFPFSPQKVIRKIIDPLSPIRPITPLPSIQQLLNPFDDIHSSLPDASVLHSTNVELNRIAEECKELKTPARNYIRHVTNFAEEFQADLAISRVQYEELHTVVEKRAEQKTEKRKSLEGQHLVSRVEFVEKWGEEEKAKKERQKTKRTQQKRKPSEKKED